VPADRPEGRGGRLDQQLEIRNGETWARIEWNADAAQRITDKWRYLSPVFDFDASGRVFRLAAVGLTNQPNLFLRALNSTDQENRMDPIDQLLRQLGISITEAMDAASKLTAALNAIKTLQDVSNSTQTAMNSLRQATGAAADADLKTVANSIMTGFVPKAEYERVANSLQQLQAGTAAAEVDKVLDEAITAGKITPATGASGDTSSAYPHEVAIAVPDIPVFLTDPVSRELAYNLNVAIPVDALEMR
jgi:phage I-like protein